jgi:hypothetical protein
MALKFNIKSTQDCGKLKYTNCSTYCDADNYLYESLIAGIATFPNITDTIRVTGSRFSITASIFTTKGLDPTNGIEWNLNSGSTVTSTGYSTLPGVVTLNTTNIGLLVSGINTLQLTATDVDGNVSVLVMKFLLEGQGNNTTVSWAVIPGIGITTNQTLAVQFSDTSGVYNRTINNNTFDLDVDSQNYPSLPQNHVFSGVGTFNNILSYEEQGGELVSLTFTTIIDEDDTNCTNQLTQYDISSVILTATSPKGNSYTTEITDNFTTLTTFDVLASSFGSFSTFESGIWTFQTIVTKVTNTGTFIFADTIKLVIICKEECSFNSYVATYAEEELDCCSSCKEEKEKKIILMSTYIDAIKNASACGELTKITKFINLLQRLLSNKNCSC